MASPTVDSEQPFPRILVPPKRRGRRIKTKIGNHSFRSPGITAYLKDGGVLEKAAAMANHASKRTTRLYAAATR